MIAYMNYVIEANIGLVITFVLYRLLLHKDTNFKLQRFFTLTGILAALLFPFITITPATAYPEITSLTRMLSEIHVVSLRTPAAGEGTTVNYMFWLAAVYAVVSVSLFLFFGLQIIRMLLFLRKGTGVYFGRRYIIESLEEVPSFSFFNLIFLGRADRLTVEEKKLVVQHEIEHSRRFHSIDVLLISLVAVLFWFNPVVWIMRKIITRVHEFEVDAAITKDQNALPEYSELLLREALTRSGYHFAHHFNQSFTLKRIEMMKTLKKKTSIWKLAASVATAGLFFFAVACQEQLYDAPSELSTPPPSSNIPVDVKTRFEQLKATYPSSEFVLLQLDQPESRMTIEKIQERARASDRQVRVSIIKPGPEDKGVGTLGILEIGPKAQGTSGDIYTIVEESATPHGGMGEFFRRIAEQLLYPQEARRLGIEGRVFVEFTVNEDGHLSDFNVVKGVHESVDAEALRVLMLAHPWHPGHHRGKVVKQKMILPINFSLGEK